MDDIQYDRTSYAPFVLMTGKFESLFLEEASMLSRLPVFEQRAGWTGNGYDWTAIARLVIDERLPAAAEQVEFDPEAGMFSVSGPLEVLRSLGAEMKRVFDDEPRLRDLVSRATQE